jgi:cytidine deaminase
VAIFAAVAACHRRIDALAVTCPQAASPAANLRMPCGACRQVIAEFASPNLVIFVDGVGEFTLDQLLPSPFGLEESRKAEPPVE